MSISGSGDIAPEGPIRPSRAYSRNSHSIHKLFKVATINNSITGVYVKISDIYSMDVYSDAGQYLGEVRDAIIDLEKGEVSRLLMEEWKSANRDEIKRML